MVLMATAAVAAVLMAAAPDRATGGCACFWWRRRADTRAAAAGPAADELGWSRARAEGSEVGRLCVVLLAMVTVVARAGGAALHHLLHRDAPGTCFTITISSRCPSTTAWSLVAASSPVARPLATLAAGPGRSARKGELLVELIHGRKSEGGFWAVGGEEETGRLTEKEGEGRRWRGNRALHR